MKDSEISGNVAFGKGKVTGHVKIISDEKDIEKGKEGDKLVITTPSAEFVCKLKSSGALQKSSALITEVGGLLSHVSIVAREMKKLCIVGAKNIIQVLKDSDEVEVDADNGLIRKLK